MEREVVIRDQRLIDQLGIPETILDSTPVAELSFEIDQMVKEPEEAAIIGLLLFHGFDEMFSHGRESKLA